MRGLCTNGCKIPYHDITPFLLYCNSAVFASLFLAITRWQIAQTSWFPFVRFAVFSIFGPFAFTFCTHFPLFPVATTVVLIFSDDHRLWGLHTPCRAPSHLASPLWGRWHGEAVTERAVASPISGREGRGYSSLPCVRSRVGDFCNLFKPPLCKGRWRGTPWRDTTEGAVTSPISGREGRGCSSLPCARGGGEGVARTGGVVTIQRSAEMSCFQDTHILFSRQSKVAAVTDPAHTTHSQPPIPPADGISPSSVPPLHKGGFCCFPCVGRVTWNFAQFRLASPCGGGGTAKP